MARDNIVDFGGLTNLDIPPRRILESAINGNLETVLLLGFQEDGELYSASSTGDIGVLLTLMERFKHKLISGDYM